MDDGSNTGQDNDTSVTLDMTAPSIDDVIISNMQLAGSDYYIGNGTVRVSVDASDAAGIALVKFYVDGSYKDSDSSAAFTYYWPTKDYTDGSHQLGLRVYDSHGNVRETGLTNNTFRDWIIDNTGPTLSTVSINSGDASTETQDVTISLSAADSGVGEVTMYFDDGTTRSTEEPYAPTKAWTLTSGDGTKTVAAYVQDKLGNLTKRTDSIVLDMEKRIKVTFTELTMVEDGDPDPRIGPSDPGEIYYRFAVDKTIVIDRPETSYLSLNVGDILDLTRAEKTFSTVITVPNASGETFTVIGQLWDDDGRVSESSARLTASHGYDDSWGEGAQTDTIPIGSSTNPVSGTITYYIDVID